MPSAIDTAATSVATNDTNPFVWRERNGLTLLICAPLERAGFLNAFTTRFGGVSSLPVKALNLGNFRQDERANILENRRRLLSALQVENWLLMTANQVHSADAYLVAGTLAALNEVNAAPPTCDALLGQMPRTLLAVQTADCMPILLADARTRAVAAVHAGWRGTHARIVARTLEQMQSAFGTRAADVLAAFGPAIQAANFEVGAEVVAQFEAAFTDAAEAISQRQPNGKAQLDLSRINRGELRAWGVPDTQIFDCGLCTVARNDLLFSYRHERGAERPVGRLMGVIGQGSNAEG